MASDKPVAETWFSLEAYDPGILRFREHNIDSYAVGDFWLLRGGDRDLLIDTGSGIVSPEPLVRAIAGKPVTAVALNSYFDHAGGWHAFEERLCHALDAPDLANTEAEDSGAGTYLNDSTLWALPYAGYRVADFRMTSAAPTGLLADGDVLDLGSRRLEVMHVPGRSPGGLALWEEASGSLFTSDMLYDGDHGPSWPPPEPEAYAKSLHRFRALPLQRVFPGHYGPLSAERAGSLIQRQLHDIGAL
ncbi:MAG: MBL fold metallo-hydrolase [Pseudomonadota bacterium]